MLNFYPIPYSHAALETKELLKIAVLVFFYGIAAPGLGILLRGRPSLQRAAFAALCFMTIGGFLQASEWGLTLAHREYRGHSRGFHFFFAEVFAIGIILARFLEGWRSMKWLPPGLILYLLYCALSFLSIVHAPAPVYVFMAAFKAVKVAVVFLAAFYFMKDELDIHFFLKAMSATMFWELFVVLKMKYLDGVYQVPGTFYHQNSLSMYVTMIGMVLLAASLGPKHATSNLYLYAYLACAAIQQATLSRAGMVIFAAGTLAVATLSLLEKFTRRRLAVLASLSFVGLIGLALTLDTIIARFHDYGNEASVETRRLLNEASSHMLEDYALGIGWNNFGLTINKPFPYGDIIDAWERAGGATVDEDAPKGIVESHYWLLLAETGYQGFISYMLFIIAFLWWNIRAIIAYRFHFLGSFSLGVFMGCACNYAHSLLERVLTQPRNMMLWMILLGIVAQIEVWRRAEKRKRRVQAQNPQSPAPAKERKRRGEPTHIR